MKKKYFTMNGIEVNYRQVCPEDVQELFELIKFSTNGTTRLTPGNLRGALFGFEFRADPTTHIREEGINFDQNLVKSNGNTCRAFVAEANNQLIGYIIFHFHYSPWLGYSTFVDDIFVKHIECQIEIVTCLIEESKKFSTGLGNKQFLFNRTSPCSAYLLRGVDGPDGDVKSLRNDKTDWGVRRIIWN